MIGDKPVALVTGVTGAVGTDMIKSLANSGYALAFAACGDIDRARALERFCAVQGVETLLLTGDVNIAGNCEQWVADTLSFFCRLDVLLCNIGYNTDDSMVSARDSADFIRVVQAEINGLTELARNAAKPMSTIKRGRIVTVSLPIGYLDAERQRLLSTAVRGMTADLAGELCKTNVTVNAVLPGFLDTLRTAKGEEAALLRQIPLGRQGTSADVAQAVRFLLSDAASYITGHTLPVTGGLEL